MDVLIVVRAVATVCTGLVAGIFLGHRRGVSLATRQLGASSFLQLQQIIHVHFVQMMPPLVLSAVGGSLAWMVLLRSSWQTPEFWLVAAAAIGMVGVLALTRAVNLPINKRLMTWAIEAPPADMMDQWRPWEQIHSVRTVIATAALVCQVVALSAFPS